MSERLRVDRCTHPQCAQKKVQCALGYSLRQREWTDHEMCLNGVCPMEHCKLFEREEFVKRDTK